MKLPSSPAAGMLRARAKAAPARQSGSTRGPTKKGALPSFEEVLGHAHAAAAAIVAPVAPTAPPPSVTLAAARPAARDEGPRGPLPHSAPARPARAEAHLAPATVAEPKGPAPTTSFQAQLATATGPAEAPAVEAARPPAGLMELSLADPSLRITGGTEVMHLNLQTAASGSLEVEVRVNRHGRTDVRIDGAAPLFAERAPELERVLASEGLSLGTYTTSDERQAPQREYPEAPDAPWQPVPSAPAPTSVTNPTPPVRHEGRIDVKA